MKTPDVMAPAPFVWRDDGRPDWGAMWSSFCDLALHGGPPHRGPEQALRAPSEAAAPTAPEVIDEMRRGIRETTGLSAKPAPGGWLTIRCHSPAMAAWLAAAIVRENVDTLVEEDRLLLPAGPAYRLADEAKSVITVVAKTHHYWVEHAAKERPRSARGIPKPLRVGVGGPARGGKTALIRVLRRRLGERLAVAPSTAAALALVDPALELVLVERTERDATEVFDPERMDATIGVVAAATLPDELRDHPHLLARWRLLVVAQVDRAPGLDLAAVDHALSARRGGRAVVYTDLSAWWGIDAVLEWLERELLLGA
jgi:Ni2+-binding GTPase involved in maturation of urease and hydrogenase